MRLFLETTNQISLDSMTCTWTDVYRIMEAVKKIVMTNVTFPVFQDALVAGYPTVPDDDKNTFARGELMYFL